MRCARQMAVPLQPMALVDAGLGAVLPDRPQILPQASAGKGARPGFGHVVMGINFSQGAVWDDLYLNRRSEMWHAVAKWLRDGGALPSQGPEAQNIEEDATGAGYTPNYSTEDTSETTESADNAEGKAYGFTAAAEGTYE